MFIIMVFQYKHNFEHAAGIITRSDDTLGRCPHTTEVGMSRP